MVVLMSKSEYERARQAYQAIASQMRFYFRSDLADALDAYFKPDVPHEDLGQRVACEVSAWPEWKRNQTVGVARRPK